jgi:hypothetical protein
MKHADLAVIRAARYGLGESATGYLLYWESETRGSQRLDSWTIYPTPAAARRAALAKDPAARVIEEAADEAR